WEVMTGRGRIIRGHVGIINAITFSKTGVLASAGDDRTVRVWALEQPPNRPLEGNPVPITATAFSHDGSLLASCDANSSVWLWRLRAGAASELKGHSQQITRLAFSADAKVLASASTDQTVRLWNVSSGESRVIPCAGNATVVQ